MFNHSQKKIIKDTSTFSFFTIISRILGLLRDLLRSFIFGTSSFAVAFDIAFRIPNMFRSLSAEGAMSQALLPIYEQYKKKDGAFAALKSLTTFITMVLIAFSVAVWFVLPKCIPYLMNDPQITNENTLLTIHLSQILFPYLVFISVSSIYTTIQYSHGIFWSGAFGPALINLIVVVLFGSYFFFVRQSNLEIILADIYIFAYVVLFSSVTQFLFQSWVLKKNRLYFGFSRKIFHPIIKSLFFLMLPAFFGVAVQQINLLIDVYLATSLRDTIPGAVSALTYAHRLIQLPMGIFAIAVNTATMPLLSYQFANQEKQSFMHSLLLSIRLSLFLMLPASLGLFIYSEEITSFLFERGEFGKESTAITAFALKYYALGISAYGVQKLLISACFAQHDTKRPAVIAGVILILNLVFSLSLMPYLQHGGLALGSSLAAYMGVFIYGVLLHRKMSIRNAPAYYYKNFLKLILLNILLFFFLVLTKKFFYFLGGGAISLLMIIIFTSFLYIASSLAAKLEEVQKVKDILKTKFISNSS